jgi:hypothetical protein
MKVKSEDMGYTHRKGTRTTNTKIITLEGNGITKKFKFSYDAYNAGETFTGESFSDDKFHHIFCLSDLGVEKNSSAYHLLSESELNSRIGLLTQKGIEFIKKLY